VSRKLCLTEKHAKQDQFIVFLFFKEIHLSLASFSIFAGRSVNVDELILGISSKFVIFDVDRFLCKGNSIRVKQILNMTIPFFIYIRSFDGETIAFLIISYHLSYANLKFLDNLFFLIQKWDLKRLHTSFNCFFDKHFSIRGYRFSNLLKQFLYLLSGICYNYIFVHLWEQFFDTCSVNLRKLINPNFMLIRNGTTISIIFSIFNKFPCLLDSSRF